MSKRLKSHKGFTLIELIAVMALIAIVGTLIISLMSFGSRQFQQVSKSIDGRSEGNFIINFITTEIKRNDVSKAVALRGNNKEILEIKSEDKFNVSGMEYTYQWIYIDSDSNVYHRFGNGEFATTFNSEETVSNRTFQITYDEKIANLTFTGYPSVAANPNSIEVKVQYYISDTGTVEEKSTLIPIKSDND